jgi:hypothetical protein
MNADEIRPLFPSAESEKKKEKNVFDREEERKKSEGGQVLANQIFGRHQSKWLCSAAVSPATARPLQDLLHQTTPAKVSTCGL